MSPARPVPRHSRTGFVSFVSFVGSLGLVLTSSGTSRADAPPAHLANTQTVFEGQFETRVADYPDGTSKTFHLISQPTIGMEIDVDPAQHPQLVRGATVRVTGKRIDSSHFHVKSVEQLSPPPQLLIDPDKRDPRRIAFILVEWDTPGGVSKGAAKQAMFQDANSTNAFYQEVSYGVEKIAGDVYGSFTISEPTGCNMNAVSEAARSAMTNAGYDTGEFIQFMYYFSSYPACGWAGLASVGSPDNPARDSWYNGSFGCVVRAQEIGHNYGMQHSKSATYCTDANDNPVFYSNSCAVSEYGDPYDPMGGGCYHINSVQKAYMGWLSECNIVTADANGTFNLMPVELPCDGTQALRFPMGNGEYYYLEYRQPLGTFDKKADLSGILVRVAGGYNGAPNTRVLDMDLNTSGRFMRTGDTLNDYQGRLSFTVLEEHATHAVIQVTYPNGGSNSNPSCEGGVLPATEGGNWGTMLCASEPFPADSTPPTVTITYPANGQQFPVGASFELTADATDENGITETELYLDGQPVQKDQDAPYSWGITDVPEGVYEFGVVALDGPNWAASDAVTIYVGVDPPDPGSTGTGGATDGGTNTGGSASGTGGSATTTDDSSTGTTGDSGDSGGSGDTDTAGANTTDGGCGCRNAGSGGASLMLFGLLFGAGQRRRRTRHA